ncbi:MULTISPECIES: cupin domain-containing protein [unclassified Mycobacteroides]|uniref:cupin domain-containing protein n=1 Tax=unclassified Mycobacteroides TaxID=2618759 RepID=UPI00132159F8|nr:MULTISPECIES: cupin domain-containing protein [unclassified Mycobacteroides]MUM19809.1 hypothetical protein [Mycobacteroides sp. CBMA 326]
MSLGIYPKPDLSRTGEVVTRPHEDGVIVRRADERALPALGMPGGENHDTVRLLLDGNDTRGAAAVVEYTISPQGDGPGLHWHRTYDEYFYVVSGKLSMQAAGRSAVFQPRDFVFVPRGVIHDFWNDSAAIPCIFVSGWTPAGSEGVWKIDDLPSDVRSDPVRMLAALDSLIDIVPVEGTRIPIAD